MAKYTTKSTSTKAMASQIKKSIAKKPKKMNSLPNLKLTSRRKKSDLKKGLIKGDLSISSTNNSALADTSIGDS